MFIVEPSGNRLPFPYAKFATCMQSHVGFCLCERTRVCRQIKHQSSQEGEEHAGYDDVDDEVEREPQHEEVVGNVQVGGVWTASVVHPMLPTSKVLHDPFSTFHKVTEIRAITVLLRKQ